MKLYLALLAATSLATGQQSDGGEWLNVPAQSLQVDPGSPLDFSSLVSGGPAGSRGTVAIANGRLTLGGAPAAPFNCGQISQGIGQARKFPTHEEADALATQMRLHGYSLVRLQNVDYLLMRLGNTDLDIHADQLDRFYYLLAALKKNGIYWMMDIVSNPGKGLMGRGYLDGASPDDLRIRMNFDPAARAEWLKFVDEVYAKPNPYTGTSILADPALAFVNGANENSIAFATRPGQPFPTGLAQTFQRWAQTPDHNGVKPEAQVSDLTASERSGAAIQPPADWSGTGPLMALFQRFVADSQIDTYRWMSAELHQRGFHGPLLADQVFARSSNNETRAALPIIDIHAYNGEVTSFAPGAHFLLPSTTDDAGLSIWLLNASARWLDRPLVASEYGQPFPNPYRYESGLFFPWLAAFQGYSAVCRNASLSVEPVMSADPKAQQLHGYTTGIDPTERAAETLSAMLFARGDASAATRTVAVPFGADQFAQTGSAFIPYAVRKAALFARFGLIGPDRTGTLPRGTQILPTGPVAYGMGSKISARMKANLPGANGQAGQMAMLRSSGILPAGNQTDPSKGLYESGNGQMRLDQKAGTIRVVTPRTEAISTTGPADSLPLDALTVSRTDAGALIAASSLDGRPVAASRRLLLILAGDSRNSGMQLAGAGPNRTLVNWGQLPVQMRRVAADLALRTTGGRSAKLTVLSLRGAPQGNAPVTMDGGTVRFHLDTGAIPASPTTYFLLELQ